MLSTLMLPGLLPRKHDRYFFLADVLAFALAVRCGDRSSLMICAAVQLGSLLALWSLLSSDPAFAAAGAVSMIAATAAVASRLLALRPSGQGAVPTPA